MSRPNTPTTQNAQTPSKTRAATRWTSGTRLAIASAVLLAVVLTAGYMLGARMPSADVPMADGTVGQRATPRSGLTKPGLGPDPDRLSIAPTEEPPPVEANAVLMTDEGYPMGPEAALDEADLVAEVTVTRLDRRRFNTAGGGPPPELGLDPSAWIYRPLRLDTAAVFKGSALAAAFVPDWGGEVEGLRFDRQPALGMHNGQTGIAFLVAPPAGLVEEPWRVDLSERAATYPGDAEVYEVLNWYAFQGREAVSTADDLTWDRDALLALLRGE